MILKIFRFLMITILSGVLSCKNGRTPTEVKNPNDPTITHIPYKIVFVSNREMENSNQLYIMDIDGNNQTRLTQDSANYFQPRFSPDGSKIVFYSYTHYTNDEIYIIDSDGSHHTNLTNTLGNDNYPQFSPDGRKIVFTSDRDGNREIYIMNIDGSNQQRLTNNNLWDHAPQFSPDGSRILFYSLDENRTYDIYTIDPNGANLTNLTPESNYSHLLSHIETDSYAVNFYGPQYFPDGSKIVFTSYSHAEYNYDIYLMNSDGSNQIRLTNTPGFNFFPRFYPNGSKIVFMTHRGDNFDLYSMDLDGSHQAPLYDSRAGHAIFSQISPDGEKMIFMDNNIDPSFHKIYLMNSNGDVLIQLTNGSYQDLFPQFQPQMD